MSNNELNKMIDFTGQTIAVTGGAGVLGSGIAKALLDTGANVAVLDLDKAQADAQFFNKGLEESRILTASGNVLEPESMSKALAEIIAKFGKVDALINGAGGNHPKSTTAPDKPFFDIPLEAFKFVMDLNLLGTVIPSQIFARHFADNGAGNILNISSMNAFRPLTRIPAYSAGKAAVSNFTQWLAVHLAQEYSPNIRVNAIAPGFFLTNQNRFLLTDEKTGELTARGKAIIDHTPMARFGNPEDLLGPTLWLLSPAANFVTGTIIPIDGGFSAFSGV
ncbi:MAG: SDR family oxidoreductase [Deferribacteres bacterium]|nr:SDR family oxidoreductase [candidate division KSB1 bacterium]MCB9501625.1 SDR family oxidoreductase [Deferribacteres bacterium]